MLVGPEQKEFAVSKKLLCASSSYFSDGIDAVPAALSSSPPSITHSDGDADADDDDGTDLAIWLSGECPRMFELFALWLSKPPAFRTCVETAIATLPKQGRRCRALHWSLVRLHLFAAAVAIPALQDYALDALQDLYLHCDWDVSPHFIRFLYVECDAAAAFRLRKWAVAMLAWTLANGPVADDGEAFTALFSACGDLRQDYDAHIAKMASSGADVRVKNPQLRIPRNALRSEERLFGFRQCSFHSHRKTVGERRCPHSLTLRSPALLSPLTPGSASSVEFGGPLMSPLRVKPPGLAFLD